MHPILLSLGPITIYSFGVFLFVGLILALFIIWRRLREQGLEEGKILDFLFLITFWGLIFARVIFIITHFELFGFSISAFLFLSRFPGLSFWGGFLGAVLVMVYFIRKNRWDFWKVADEVVFGFAPFTVLSHLGCFLDGCSLGRQTGAFWGIFFPGSLLRRHPFPLFEAIVFLIIWLFLLRIERRWRTWEWYKSHAEGFISLSFLTCIFLASFALAFLQDDKIYLMWLKRVLSLIVAGASATFLYRRSGRKLKEDFKIIKRPIKKEV